jgi:DNA-directed RNA polymerase specialized sigma24 family protein
MSNYRLDDPSLRSALTSMVRRKVPASDVDDVVQSTLADALSARELPAEPERLRRWVFGIARHKIVDAHRARGREVLDDHEAAAAAVEDAEFDALDLLRWAERELPQGAEARTTLGLMLREGDGERLEHLAAEAMLPAATVRQRVVRLRRHFRACWAFQAAVLLLLLLGGLLYYAAFSGRVRMAIHPVVGGAPSESIGASPSPSAIATAPEPSTAPSTPPTTLPTTLATDRPLPTTKPPSMPKMKGDPGDEGLTKPKSAAPPTK